MRRRAEDDLPAAVLDIARFERLKGVFVIKSVAVEIGQLLNNQAVFAARGIGAFLGRRAAAGPVLFALVPVARQSSPSRVPAWVSSKKGSTMRWQTSQETPSKSPPVMADVGRV